MRSVSLLSSLITPSASLRRTQLHGACIRSFCASTPYFTHLQFASNQVWRATHRSGIGRRLGNNGYNGGRGPQGPWQRIKDRINAIPSSFIFWGIIGLNGVVFVSWNLAWAKYQSTGDPSSYVWMRNHFVGSMNNIRAGRWYTLLTSCFSHENAAHILFNGFTFYFMAPMVLGMIGNVSFLGLYLGGGVLSSLASIAWRNYSQPRSHSQITGSHGASGAIYAVVSFFACVAPTTTFYFFGIVPVPAWALVTGIFLYDSYGAVTHSSGTTDAAGHVGGIASGIGYFIAKRLRIL